MLWHKYFDLQPGSVNQEVISTVFVQSCSITSNSSEYLSRHIWINEISEIQPGCPSKNHGTHKSDSRAPGELCNQGKIGWSDADPPDGTESNHFKRFWHENKAGHQSSPGAKFALRRVQCVSLGFLMAECKVPASATISRGKDPVAAWEKALSLRGRLPGKVTLLDEHMLWTWVAYWLVLPPVAARDTTTNNENQILALPVHSLERSCISMIGGWPLMFVDSLQVAWCRLWWAICAFENPGCHTETPLPRSHSPGTAPPEHGLRTKRLHKNKKDMKKRHHWHHWCINELAYEEIGGIYVSIKINI